MKVASSALLFPLVLAATAVDAVHVSSYLRTTTSFPTASPTPVGGYTGHGSSPPFVEAGSQSSSTDCPTSSPSCSSDGSTNYHEWSNVAYDATNGYFSASLVTNQCNAYDTFNVSRAPSCLEQTIPDVNFDERKPYQMPLLDTVAWSLKGENVYSPYEDGFWSGQLCDGVGAHGGMDILVLDYYMTEQCPNHVITQSEMLLDDCGAHAIPYHYHEDLVCAYDHTNPNHSPLIAIALTGQGVYGKFENGLQPPTDLDECNGHWGPVPASDELGTDGSEWVYHYHTTDVFPFTLGCFGPLQDTSCTELNEEACVEWDPVELEIMTESNLTETIEYRYWCPCRSDNPDAVSLSETSDALDRTRKHRALQMREHRRNARV